MSCDYSVYKPTQNSIDYLTKIPAFIDATTNVCNEVAAARNGQTSLLLSIQSRVPYSGWTQNVNANGFTINGLPNATESSQPVNFGQVLGLIATGGVDPLNVPVTGWGVGTLTDGQVLINNGGVLEGKAVKEIANPILTKWFARP